MGESLKDLRVIFLNALDIKDPERRKAYVDQACRADGKLKAEVQALLKAHEEAGDFLEGPPIAADATLDTSPHIDGPAATVGRYQLLKLIGEGGMGLVYLAEQQEPVQRQVAFKIIKPGMDSREVIARFEAERQTLAVLDHPNIAHVFDAGMTKMGRPYFVMEHVRGLSITEYCDEHKLSVEERLKLFREVCEGVYHAHQKGIIHRDIKPSNILVAVHGDRAVPKIIDFGVAKAITAPLVEATAITRQGQLLGTPEYMSPEQVDMATADIDTRSDIYSLGVLLYELLAGVLPFDREVFRQAGLAEIQQTLQEEPTPPSTRLTSLGDKAQEIADCRRTQLITLARCLHRELEWIPMKAIRKDRSRRYRSASELSDDIHNYLNGLPLIAGPESNVYRAKKFVRKHAGSVTSAALVAVVIILGFVTSTVFSFKAEKARGEEAAARAQAEEARDKEAALRAQVEEALARAEKAEATAEERNEDYRRSLYVNSIQLADAKYCEGNIGNARKLLESCPNDVRGWEWDRVDHVLDQSMLSFATHQGQVTSVALSPDGKRVVSGGSDGALKIWDMTTGRELTKFAGAHTGRIFHVEFGSQGKRLVSCSTSGEVKVWNAGDVNEPITSIRHGSNWVPSVSFSPDGNQIVSALNDDGTIKVWDAATGAEILAFGRQKGGVRFAAFSPKGKHIVSADEDGIITIWDCVSGDEVMHFAGHDQEIRTMSFNSDGSLFASGSSDNTIKIWDAIMGSLMITLHGHEGPINAVAFSPDHKYVVSCSWDCTVRIWDIATGGEIKTLRGHKGMITSVAFTPDSRQVVSASWDGTVRVWDVTVDRDVSRFLGHGGIVRSIAFGPDGKRLVSCSNDGTVKVWDVTSCSETATFSGRRDGIYPCSASFSPDGKRVASLNEDKAIVIRDAETGSEIATLGDEEDDIVCLALSPDGRRIVSGSYDGKLKLWDALQGEELMFFGEGGPRVLWVAFSPDGHRIASCGMGRKIGVWDVTSGAELMSLVGHGNIINSVMFSPDGKRVVSSCQNDYTAKIWDAATGKELKTLRGHGDIVTSIAISPDGRRLVTGSRDGTARVWDSSTGDELLTLRADSAVATVAFSPDGKSIAGGTFGGTIALWESAAPAGGYGPRRTAATARCIVDELHETYGLYRGVVDQLEADTKLDESLRKVAMQIANSRKVEDAEMLTREGWEIVSSADKDIEAYKSVVDKAQKVARSEPRTSPILRTLGVGQYRVGAYADALDTLKNAEQIRTNDDLESDPNNLAFLAMTQFQLGQINEGRSAINTLRDSLEVRRFADVTSGRHSCWIEAERVFAGRNERLVAVWDLIRAEKLDRAVEMFREIESPLKETDGDFAFSLQGISKYLSRACYARGKSRLLDKDQGQIDRASDYEAAVSVDPNYVSALEDLAWLKTTCPVEKVRNPAEAVELATRACELTDWKNHEYLSVLAGACSENGQLAEAAKWQQEAIALLPEEDQANWASNYRERLRLYRSNLPYSAGRLWSFTEGELISFWDFNDVQGDVVKNRIVGGSEVRLADGGRIVAEVERGDVLDLSESSVECTLEPDFDITGAITIGAWIKLRPTMEGWHVIVSKGERGQRGWAMSTLAEGYATMSINILKREEHLLGLTKDPSRYLPVSANGDLKDDNWHHVVGTYDGERVCVYVDGELGNSKPIQGDLTTNNGPVVIGDNPEWAGQGYDWSWNGLIDDVCIYSYALSSEEVKMLYEGKEPPRNR